MATLLYLQCSPRSEKSFSSRIADAFALAYSQAKPADDVITINIFEKKLIQFNGLALQGKYALMHGQSHSPEQATAWQAVEQTIAEFLDADKYLFSIPMWNFSIPYRLKQYLDIIIQPGYTFSFSPESGYQGLIKDKPVCCCYARGGEYAGPAATYDLQSKYMNQILQFIGFEDIQSIMIEPTLAAGPDAAQTALDKAILKAQQMAGGF